jgi:probable addiction module antidote protein
MVKIAPFDTARHLDNPEVIAHYLTEAFQTRDSKLILRAISNVVRAGRIKPVSKIARETGLSRTSLYWKEKASPEFTTVLKVLDSVGVQLTPIARRGERRPRPAAPAGRRGASARKPHGARPH